MTPSPENRNGEPSRSEALSDQYVQYRKDLWEDRLEQLGMKLCRSLFLPAGIGVLLRLAELFDPDPDIQLVKQGWSWPGVFFVLTWVVLMRSVGHLFHEPQALESVLRALTLQSSSLLEWLIVAGLIMTTVPGLLVLGILAIWVMPVDLVPLLAVPLIWRQMMRFHWACASLLSVVLVVAVVWRPFGMSDSLLTGLAGICAGLFGRWGNGWREQTLVRRGYAYRETVRARRSPVWVYVRY